MGSISIGREFDEIVVKYIEDNQFMIEFWKTNDKEKTGDIEDDCTYRIYLNKKEADNLQAQLNAMLQDMEMEYEKDGDD